MTNDKVTEIRARHERDNRYGDGLYPGAHKDRAWLLAEVERLQKRDAEWTEKAAAWMASAGAAQRLDGYRRLASELNEARAEIERLTRERDEARAWAAKLLATLEMVRDADNDCRVEGWATIPDAARRGIDEALEVKP